MTGPRVRRAAVLGHPIGHTLSPVIHRAAYEALGIADISYGARDVDSEGLAAFIEGCDPQEWVGLSLTMPLKHAVLPLLATHTPTVELAQAANTVLFRDGHLHGDNTDVPGMVAALETAGVSTVSEGVILGAGATARSAVVALAELGAPRLTVAARRAEAAAGIVELASRLGIEARVASLEDLPVVDEGSVVVSTLPAAGHDGLLDWSTRSGGVLFDVIYEPWPTPLAAAWAGRVLGGVELLVQQGARQVELMTGRPGPVAAMREAALSALAVRQQG